MVVGIGQGVKTSHLSADHIKKLAPHLVGQAVWRAVKHRRFTNWPKFRDVIEQQFGLTPDELLDDISKFGPVFEAAVFHGPPHRLPHKVWGQFLYVVS